MSAFAAFGEVASVKVMRDRRGRTKQFAYVQMAEEIEAKRAMQALRGTRIKGRIVDIVMEEQSRARSRQRPGR